MEETVKDELDETTGKVEDDMEDIKEEIVQQVLEELRNKKLLFGTKSSYKSTEKLLYSLPALPEAIELLEEEIKSLEEEMGSVPITNVKSNTVVLNEKNCTYVYGDETLKTRISELKQNVIKAKSQIRLANAALEKIEDDEYYPLIEELYFTKPPKTYEQLKEFYGWAKGTITKHRKDLIHKLKVYIYPSLVIDELNEK